MFDVCFELKNGKGFVKEYDKYGSLIFEGEYLNSQRNGKGKEYSKNERLFFPFSSNFDFGVKKKKAIIM